MEHTYSLVHLTNIACPPPEFIRTAARAGFDAVSLRTIPLGLPGERPYDLAHDSALLRETKRALEETGLLYTDTEIARIAEHVDVADHEPALAAAAEMGVTQVLTNIWIEDRGRYTEQFVKLCELARQYGQTVNLEFVTWAGVTDLKQSKRLLWEAGQPNVGIVVDMLHFHRSRVALEELDDCPGDWFHYVHLCDCEDPIPKDVSGLAHTAREARLCPGEGTVPVREIVARIPNQNVVYGLEIPNTEVMGSLGFEAYVRSVLEKTKRYMNG